MTPGLPRLNSEPPPPMSTTIEEIKGFLDAEDLKYDHDAGDNFIRTGFKTEHYANNEGRKSLRIIIELVEGGESVSLAKDKPFKRVEGYMVDLKYPLENRPPWLNQRVGGALKFGGEDYNIVAITKTEVVVLAKSNLKKMARVKTA